MYTEHFSARILKTAHLHIPWRKKEKKEIYAQLVQSELHAQHVGLNFTQSLVNN